MKKDDRHSLLVRSVLVGLAAGVTALPLSAAEARTLSEFKADLARENAAYQTVLDEGTSTAAAGSRAAGETIIASTGDNDDNGNKGKHIILDSSTQYKELRAEDDGWMTITAKNGAVIPAVTVNTGFKSDSANGGQINITVGDVDWSNPSSIKDNTDQVADMTNVTFKAEGGNIVFTNGTSKVKAENLFGGAILGAYSNGSIDIGSDEAKVHAVVKLEGNTKFNTDNWVTDNGETVSGSNYIRLTEYGTLEANSEQIFDKGLGAEGETDDPEAIRSDADYAIDFEAGKLLLDDDKYNESYLEKANTLVKAADGGTTEVVVKDTASKVDLARDIASVPDDSYAAGVTTSKTDVVIGDNGDSTVNKLNATYLNLAAAADGSAGTVTVTDGRTLALGSDADGRELITADNAKPAQNVQVSVQDGSKLTLGRFDVANRISGDIQLTGANASSEGSQLSVENGQLTVGSVNADSGTTVNVASGATLSAENGITLSGATMQVNGTVKDTDIKGDANSAILIGNDASAGKMLISGDNTAAMTGTKVFLDPVWKDGATISDASQFAAEDSSNVDYLLTVGRNSLASLGTADTSEAVNAFNATGLTWGEDAISAALYLAAPVTLGTNGGIKVDGTATDIATDSATAGTAEFADNSLLMVNASTLSGSAALTGSGALQVADSAKLYLDNVSDGETYTIADGFSDTSAAKGWYADSSNIITGKLFGATLNSDSTVTASRKKLQEALPGAVLPNIVDSMTFTDKEKADAPASGYIAQVTNGLLSDSQSTQFINVAAQPAETVGATATAVANSLDFAAQAQEHLSVWNASVAKANEAWVKYNHRNGSVDSLAIGGMSTGYDSNFNGVTVGYDLPETNSFRHGFAFSYGKGSNSGDWENNDYNTKGISWYGSLRNGSNNMLFDLGYYHTQHEVKGLLQAKPKTDVFTMGITNEFCLPQGKDGSSAIVPHIGLRYSHVGTPGYTGYYGGAETFRYKPSGKNLVSMPFGVGFVSESRNSAQTTRFYADASYVPVLGGRSADMHVQAYGIDAEDVFAYDASYGSAFVGSLGVKQESNSFEWGLSYRYNANSNQHSNDVVANIAFKF